MSTHFGRALIAARVEHGETQASLAAKMESRRGTSLPAANIAHWESGRRVPEPQTACAIARALGLPGNYFLQALVCDMQETMCRAEELTMVVVGVRAYAASHTHESWVAIRARVA